MLAFDIPDRGRVELAHLVLDLNGTLTNRGHLIEGVRERLAHLRARLEVILLSADTFGTLETVAASLGVEARTVATGDEKARVVAELGPERCAAIGNGTNDRAMLQAAVLAVAVVGPEGASAAAVMEADIVCLSIQDALDLLLDERTLVATLRG